MAKNREVRSDAPGTVADRLARWERIMAGKHMSDWDVVGLDPVEPVWLPVDEWLSAPWNADEVDALMAAAEEAA